MSRTSSKQNESSAPTCAHRLHMAITQSICNCADCGELLPIFALRLKTSEDLIVEALRSGIIVSWPSIVGTAVADA